MPTMQETVVSFFEKSGWTIVELEQKNSWRVPFTGTHGQWDCYARVREKQQHFVFYSILPARIDESRRTEAARLLSQINFGLIIGNFELDLNDGELRYKTSIDISNDRLSHALMKSLVFTNVLTMDQHYVNLMAMTQAGGQTSAIDTTDTGSGAT